MSEFVHDQIRDAAGIIAMCLKTPDQTILFTVSYSKELTNEQTETVMRALSDAGHIIRGRHPELTLPSNYTVQHTKEQGEDR